MKCFSMLFEMSSKITAAVIKLYLCMRKIILFMHFN